MSKKKLVLVYDPDKKAHKEGGNSITTKTLDAFSALTKVDTSELQSALGGIASIKSSIAEEALKRNELPQVIHPPSHNFMRDINQRLARDREEAKRRELEFEREKAFVRVQAEEEARLVIRQQSSRLLDEDSGIKRLSIQQQREEAIAKWLNKKELPDISNPIILNMTQKEALRELNKEFPHLFSISESTFKKVWKKQKKVHLQKGRPNSHV